jgi:hypothetical protein
MKLDQMILVKMQPMTNYNRLKKVKALKIPSIYRMIKL